MVVKTFDDGSEMKAEHVAGIVAFGLFCGAATCAVIEVKERIRERRLMKKIAKSVENENA